MPDPVSSDDKTLIKPLEELGGGMPQHFVPYLVLVQGPRQGMRFPLRTGENTGGRLPTNQIVLEDQSVSRQHFSVIRTVTGIAVKDLGSKNGTLVNGQPIPETVTIGHGDIVQIGIYALRLITRAVAPEEELEPVPPEYEGRTVVMELPPDAETATHHEGAVEGTAGGEGEGEERGDTAVAPSPALAVEEEPERRRPRWLILGLWLLVGALLAGLGYLAYTRYVGSPPAPRAPVVAKPVAECPPGQVPVAPRTDPLQCVPEAPKPKMLPVFLDFDARPLPAKVQFEGKDFGMTRITANMQLEVGKTYTADALFHLDELREDLTEHYTFTVKETDTSIPILFRGPIGSIKILRLPREVEVLARGFFAHAPLQPRTFTLANVAYGKPIYAPYGRYEIELRGPRPVGDAGQVVTDIRYRREVFVTEDAAIQTIEVTDDDLTQFPVEIRSVPDRADLFVDTKPVGKTPYQGLFPLGEHTLTLRKEGYFEHTEQLRNDINEPFQKEIALKTTAAGARINEGQALLLKGMYKEAIAKLSEVFPLNPLPVETAKAQYLLGSAFLGLNDLVSAQGYFEQAKTHPDYELQSKLGLVNIANAQGEKSKAIYLLGEVMLKATDPQIKQEAANTFKTVSPFKSVIYVQSDPPGATVAFNDQAVGQKTPLFLTDLGLGNYRLRIQKEGYEPQDLNMNLTIHEFNPVIVKLKPIAK